MERIIVNFFRYKNLVLFENVYIPEGLRNKGEIASLADDDGHKFSISSASYPELLFNKLMLNGRHSERDGEIASRFFSDEKSASHAMEMFRKVIETYNGSSDGTNLMSVDLTLTE